MEIIIGVLGGLLCGLTTLIPGWGVGLACWLSLLIPGSSLYALLSGLIISSIMEARISSQNTFGAMFNIKLAVDNTLLANSLILNKLIVFIVGLVVGTLLPPIMGGSVFVTNLVIVALLISCAGLTDTLWRSIVWLLAIQILMFILEAMAVPYPILAIGLMLFVIPYGLNIYPAKQVNILTENKFKLSIVPMVISILLSIGTIGISPASLITWIGKKESIISNYIGVLISTVAIEGIALGQAMGGGDLIGKAMVSLYVNSVSIGPNTILSSLGIILISVCTAYILNNKFNFTFQDSLSAYIGCFGLIMVTGLWALILVPLGIGYNYLYGLLRIPSEAQGLTYVALIF